LVCTGILKTLHVGCGLTGHDFATFVVTGVQANQTTIMVDLKAAVSCGRRDPDFGTMKVVRGYATTSAKRRVGTIPWLTKLPLDFTLNMAEKITSL